MLRRTFVLLTGILALSGCVQPQPPGQYVGYVPPNGTPAGPTGLAPGRFPAAGAPGLPAAGGRGVALLVAMSGPTADRGQALVNAAKLALGATGGPPLDVRDTGGTPQGAAQAAQAAIAAGDALILGPLTSGETAAAAAVARPAGIPILAFTNDPAQAQPGVWTLGITPGQQVRRMVGAVMAQGKNRFAAVLPQNDFGNAMSVALTQATSSAGAPAPDIHMYGGGGPSMDSAVRGVAAYTSRMEPLITRQRAAREEHTTAGREQAAQLAQQDAPPPSFDALLLAETGGQLATLTGLLSSYEVGPPSVRLLGPALWGVPSVRGGASLSGAWYAAPDPSTRAGFEQQYTAAYSTPPPGYTDFAFDAAAIARVLPTSGGYSVAALCRPDGYAGVDGLFVLQPDGTVRRGLALFEIQGGTPQIVQPAPTTLAAPGI